MLGLGILTSRHFDRIGIARRLTKMSLPAEAVELLRHILALRPTLKAVAEPITKDGRSWIILARKFRPIDAASFDLLWRGKPENRPKGIIMGRQVTFPRFTQSYGVDYTYTGQCARALPWDRAPPNIIDAYRELKGLIKVTCPKYEPNSALVNFYETSPGDTPDYMGLHSDDERTLVAGAPIVSLTWCTRGHTRRFRLKPVDTTKDAVVPTGWKQSKLDGAVVALGNGDLVIMGGACQRTHKHEVMKPLTRDPSERCGRRINVTLRRFTAKVGKGMADDAAGQKHKAVGGSSNFHLSGIKRPLELEQGAL